MAIVDRGKLLALGSPQELKNTYGSNTIISLKLRNLEPAESVAADLRLREGVTNAEVTPEGLRIFASGADGVLAEIIQSCARLGLRDISITEPSLETVFIHLTGRDLRE